MTEPHPEKSADRPDRLDEFYRVVGETLTQWASIEQELFEILHHTLGTDRSRSAIVYFRTPSVLSRLQLTEELFSSFFPKKTVRTAERTILALNDGDDWLRSSDHCLLPFHIGNSEAMRNTNIGLHARRCPIEAQVHAGVELQG